MNYQKITFLALAIMLLSAPIFAQPDPGSRLKDQQFLDDIIVVGSACIGQDCSNGESFGFDTIRLKENNLRIKFQDTSTSASFPSNDWQLTANDSSNGGQNKFSIDDITSGRTPFTVEAAAPSHSLYVDDGGRIGLGTSTPVADIHVKSGNTPTLRLEQDGTSGFAAQIWDLAGNEANLFLRDASNGSTLPFRLFPGAPSNSLVIEGSTGDIGMGTTSPDARLDIESNQSSGDLLRITNLNNASTLALGVGALGDVVIGGSASGTGVSLDVNADNGSNIKLSRTGESPKFIGVSSGDQLIISDFVTTTEGISIDNAGNVGMGILQATERLHVVGNIFATGTVNGVSDKRLKSNIRKFDKGLKEVLALKTFTYQFNGEAGTIPNTDYIGLIAQDLQKVVPELIKEIEIVDSDRDGKVKSRKNYLSVKESEIKYLFINAFKDQQEIIETQNEKLIQLEKDNAELRKMMLEVQGALDEIAEQEVELNNPHGSFINQNTPNPFNGETSIGYFIADDVSKATIHITDISGKLIRTVDIREKGKGILSLKANELTTGTYTYSLIVDGTLVSTNRMILAK